MYTLAGACSAFRRADFEKAAFYSNRTVSEDTDMTWALHRAGVQIGFIPLARVFLEPVTNWDELYGQRVRWARGQLEVARCNDDLVGGKKFGTLSRRELPKMLLLDHTLAFPRLVWTPLVLFFPLLGYSPALIAIAIIAMYVFYVGIEVISMLAVFAIAEEDSRHRIERSAWSVLGLPIFRFVVFHFRFSGFLVALTEEQKWTVTGGVSEFAERFDIARVRSVQLLTSVVRGFMFIWSLAARAILPLLPVVALGIVEWLVKRVLDPQSRREPPVERVRTAIARAGDPRLVRALVALLASWRSTSSGRRSWPDRSGTRTRSWPTPPHSQDAATATPNPLARRSSRWSQRRCSSSD